MFQFVNSSLGRKYIMAVTGLMLLGFVVAHLLGNLQIFAGPDAINTYAQALKDLGPLLWVARVGLITVFVLHIATAIQLSQSNRNARPTSYRFPATLQASGASQTMVLTGLVVLAYVIYHLAHFTFHSIDGNFTHLTDSLGRHDVYRMIVTGFSNPVVALTYIIANFVLALHISHGASSVFQSLGLNGSKYRCCLQKAGPALGILLFIGYASIPLSVWLGFVR